jgi:PAS domain S-box-containing protein
VYRIMLIEDEAIVAIDIQQRLETFGYEVVACAASGEEAAQIAQRIDPNLILMDIKNKDGVDGIETAARIRRLLDVPVIYLTADNDEPTLSRVPISEANAYLVKPVEDRDLRSTIEIMLYKHHMERKLRESEERFTMASLVSNDGLWDWNLVNSEVYYSPNWKALLGIPEEQVMGLPHEWIDRIHPDDVARLKQAMDNHLQGISASLKCECRMRHNDGNYRWMLCRGLALFDVHNKPYRIAGSITDITSQKKTFEKEKQRRKEAELLQQATFSITSSLDLQEVLNHILAGLEQVVPLDSAAISLIEGDYMKIAALGGSLSHTRQIGEKIGKFEGLFSLLESARSPVILKDAQAHPKYEQWSKEGHDPIHGWMGVPLIAHDHPIGFLMVNCRDRNVYTADHARLAQAFANQAVVAIENARLFEQVRKGRERLQALSEKLVEIQETERRLIAHELHDKIGQELTGLQFILLLGKEGTETERNRSFDEAQALVSNLMSEVREMSLNLHPAMLDDLGLLPTLKGHFDRFQQQTGIQIHFEHKKLDLRFPAEVELAAFRLIQESLTNVARYAAVKEVDISIHSKDDSLYVKVEDHGRGFDMEILKDTERSFGVMGIRERTYQVGGKFEITSYPGKGTCINAIFPIGKSLERRENDRPSSVSR